MEIHSRPHRPFGLSLALVAMALLLGILPLIVAGFLVFLDQFVVIDAERTLAGIDVLRLPAGPLIALVALATCYLAIVILAWRGRPRIMRVILPMSVSLVALVLLIFQSVQIADPPPVTSLDSGDAIQSTMTNLYIGALVMLALYTVWFSNRWSARAYFRGYYTDEDKRLMREAGWLSASDEGDDEAG